MEATAEMETGPGLPFEADETPRIGNLAAALAKAQGAMANASKDKENPHFRSRYADLASIWDACRAALSANGLCVMQRVSTVAEGVMVTTTLAHASGEWVRDRAVFPVAQRTPQAYGSAITYARRYALASLVGVAAGDDDDGNEASVGGSPGSAPPPRQAPRQQAAKKTEAKPAPKADPVADAKAQVARARAKRIWEAAQRNGLSLDEFKEWTHSTLGHERPSTEWTEDEMAQLEAAMAAEAQMSREATA